MGAYKGVAAVGGALKLVAASIFKSNPLDSSPLGTVAPSGDPLRRSCRSYLGLSHSMSIGQCQRDPLDA